MKLTQESELVVGKTYIFEDEKYEFVGKSKSIRHLFVGVKEPKHTLNVTLVDIGLISEYTPTRTKDEVAKDMNTKLRLFYFMTKDRYERENTSNNERAKLIEETEDLLKEYETTYGGGDSE